MKRRDVDVVVTDHAVLRWLEREHGLDVDAVKRAVAGIVMDGAQLGALHVVLGRVLFFLMERETPSEDGRPVMVVVTARPKDRQVKSRREPRDDEDE